MNDTMKEDFDELKKEMNDLYEKSGNEAIWLFIAVISCLSLPYEGFKISAFAILIFLFCSKLVAPIRSFSKRFKDLKIKHGNNEGFNQIQKETKRLYYKSWKLIVCLLYAGIAFIYVGIIE